MRDRLHQRYLSGLLSLAALSLCAVFSVAVNRGTTANAQVSAEDTSAHDVELLSPQELAVFDAMRAGDSRATFHKLISALKNDDGESRHRVLSEMLYQHVDTLGNWSEAQKAIATLPSSDALDFIRARVALRMGDMPLVQTLETKLGFLTGWMLLGPFDNERGDGFDKAYISGPEGVSLEGQVHSETKLKGAVKSRVERALYVKGTVEEISPPSLERTYTGKAEHEIRWRSVPVAPRLGYLDLDALLRPNDESLAYAFTTIEASAACDATLGIASNEGVRLFVNGFEIPLRVRSAPGVTLRWGDSSHRTVSFDQNVVRVPLLQGTNSIMLKVAEAEGPWGFRARVTTTEDVELDAASPLERAVWSERIAQSKENWGELTALKSNAIEGKAEMSLRDRFWAGLGEFLFEFSERKDKRAYKLLKQVHDDLESSASEGLRNHLRYVLALASSSTAETSAAGVDENFKLSLLTRIIEDDAEYTPALIELAKHYNETLEIPRKAAGYAARAYALAPSNLQAGIQLAKAYSALGLSGEYKRIMQELQTSHPTNSTVLTWLAYMSQDAGEYVAARDLYRKALNCDAMNSFARKQVMRQRKYAGDVTSHKSMIESALQYDPFNTEFRTLHADVLASQGREQEALATLKTALELSPNDDQLLDKAATMATRAADALARKAASESVESFDGRPVVEIVEERREQAIAWVKRALEYQPTRSDLKRYVEFLEGEAPIWEVRLQQDISDTIKQSLQEKHSDQDPAHWIYADRIVHVEGDGTAAYFNHTAVKATNERGREILRYFLAVGFGDVRIIEANIHKADGTVMQAQIQGQITMNPSIEVGDIVEARWRSFDTESGFFGDYFGDIGVMDAPMLADLARQAPVHGLPIEYVRQIYVTPKDKHFTFYSANGAPEPTVSQRGDMILRTYERHDVPRFEDELLSPPRQQLHPTVYVSTYKDWESFGKWYYNLIKRQMVATPAIIAKVEELTNDALTEEDKVRAIYNFIVQEIRYKADWEGAFNVHAYKPFEAGTIFDRCVGDCKDTAILMSTMLQTLGIECYPVLINSEQLRGNEDLTVAGPLHFNHAIAYVRYKDGSEIYLDGTETYRGYGELPDRDAGALVCVVTPEGGKLMRTPLYNATDNAMKWSGSIALQADGSAKASMALKPSGAKHAMVRQVLEAEGRRKQILEQYLASNAVGTGVSNIVCDDLTNLDLSADVSMDLEMPRFATGQQGELSFSPIFKGFTPVGQLVGAISALEERTNDMLLPPPFATVQDITFSLPVGMKLKSNPEDVSIENEHFRYQLSFTQKDDGSLSVIRSWELLSNYVPREDYKAFRKALKDSATAEKVRLTIVIEESPRAE